MTIVLRVDPLAPDDEIIAAAAAVIRRGGVAAFPTETVYGLGANALDPVAVERIFAAKSRPLYDPLIVHAADESAVRDLVAQWPDRAARAAAAFWPGPLTLILPKTDRVPDIVTAGLRTVAVRVPAHPIARALLRATRLPIAAPSANSFTGISPTRADHVVSSLGARVDFVLDGGPAPLGIESTVLDLSVDPPVVLRAGMVTRSQLEAVVGPLGSADPSDVSGDRPRTSPGMLDRHYAPRARVVIANRMDLERVAANAGLNANAVVLVYSSVEPAGVVTERLPADPSGYASGLYAALHAIDRRNYDLVIVERVPATEAWDGVRDRLERASTPPP